MTETTNTDNITTTIELLGKPFQIKTQEHEVPALQKAAEYLNNTLKAMPNPGKLATPEKLGIMAALNLASQILELEQQMTEQLHFLNQRLSNLQHKLESALDLANPLDQDTPFRLETESVQA